MECNYGIDGGGALTINKLELQRGQFVGDRLGASHDVNGSFEVPLLTSLMTSETL